MEGGGDEAADVAVLHEVGDDDVSAIDGGDEEDGARGRVRVPRGVVAGGDDCSTGDTLDCAREGLCKDCASLQHEVQTAPPLRSSARVLGSRNAVHCA
jgi:hypothetical protein